MSLEMLDPVLGDIIAAGKGGWVVSAPALKNCHVSLRAVSETLEFLETTNQEYGVPFSMVKFAEVPLTTTVWVVLVFKLVALNS